MEWHERFKINQEVRVVRKIKSWHLDDYNGNGYTGRGANWTDDMDMTLGKVFKIVRIDRDVGYRLETNKTTFQEYNYWYPVEALQALVGTQLEFEFMNS